MSIATILSIIGFVTSLLSLIIVISTIRLRRKAEIDLYILMRNHKNDIKEKIQRIEEFKKSNEYSKENILTFNEFIKLDAMIEELANTLDKDERDQIFHGLKQKSIDSKLDYIDKLLIQSGSTETQIF